MNVYEGGQVLYPLIIIAFGILGSLITSVLATDIQTVDVTEKIEKNLKIQLLVSSLVMVPLLYLATLISLSDVTDTLWKPYVCTLLGLFGGLLIGFQTDYMTSYAWSPV